LTTPQPYWQGGREVLDQPNELSKKEGGCSIESDQLSRKRKKIILIIINLKVIAVNLLKLKSSFIHINE